MAGATVHSEKLLRELDELWIGLGQEMHEDGSTGVLRACAMTLIVLTEPSANDPALGETLAALMPEHPSRVIVVEISAGDERTFSAGVTAQCWKPFGSRQQICCEQIVITATSAGLSDLPPVLRALMVPDLPIALWCRHRSLIETDGMEPLLGLADKVILSSSGGPDPHDLLAHIEGLRSNGRIVADLSWTRLTRWRETIAQVFANAARRPFLDQGAQATVRYYGRKPGMRAFYAAAWLFHALGGTPDVRLTPAERAPCQPEGEVAALAIEAPDLSVTIRQIEGEAVEIRAGDLVRRTVYHQLNDCELLREELSIEGRDLVYEAVLDEIRRFVA